MKSKLSHTIICFFDQNKVFEFFILFNSIKKIYSDFKIISSVDFDVSKTILSDLSSDDRVVFNTISTNDLKAFKKEATPKHINSVMTFGRLLIPYFNIFKQEEKIIYLDVDTILFKKIDEKYLVGENNYVFSCIPDENFDDLWDAYKKLRINVHMKFPNGNDKIEISNKILKLIDERKYFNAGIIIINNNLSFSNLIKKIFDGEKIVNTYFCDQDLLNFFNENELEIINDQRMNYLIFLRNYNIKTKPIIGHFAGNENQKKLMHYLYENNFNFDFLNLINDKRQLWDIISKDILDIER